MILGEGIGVVSRFDDVVVALGRAGATAAATQANSRRATVAIAPNGGQTLINTRSGIMSDKSHESLTRHDAMRSFSEQRLEFIANHFRPMASKTVSDSQGRSIHLLELANAGKPLIMIHGGGSEASEWTSLLPHLRKAVRIILVDRPGHGLSYKLDYTGVPVRAAAADFVHDLLNALEIDRADIVANSIGGYFALCFALAHPERVSNLVLVGAPAGIDRRVSRMMRVMGTRWLNRPLFRMMRNPTPEQMRERGLSGFVVNPDRISDEEVKVKIAAGALPGAELSFRTLLENVLDFSGFRERYYLREEVKSLSLSTTFVWGEHDSFSPPASGRELAHCMPDARFVLVENAGHIPWVDAPEQCANAINEAIASVQPKP